MSQRTEQKGNWLRSAGSLLSILACTSLLASPVSASPATPDSDSNYLRRAERILKFSPIIDGHNDLPNFIRKTTKLQIYDGKIPFDGTLSGHTDLKRLRKGRVGGQFWSVYTSCPIPAIPIDDPTERQDCQFPGHRGGTSNWQLFGRFTPVYELGVRYITVKNNCDNAFATAQSTVAEGRPDPGLTKPFGLEFIKEMNRLGMLVDLSHVSANTMRDTLKVARAPVIFSHSSAYTGVAKNNGVVMVTFVSRFVKVDDPDSADIEDVVDHIFHIAKGCGLGPRRHRRRLRRHRDVSKYPHLIAAVLKRGATSEEARKLAGENILRVWSDVERVARRLQRTELPNESYWEGRNWTRPARRDLSAIEGRSVPLFQAMADAENCD
ncbi:conserved hypothetical protein [Uncinocarpus reesii 1704]|uniref:Dipeptidase n=1 Tax=Uncinocarpus reesii (strain UAMH 1704) TaxID=336963 RepID=C4JRT8_UNCRE|nr:uncharacterized protein UREG_05177 [Uncinocarpus reesii 1704]EEP80335.1 conserved hypothetical protein [Uncinocarpus reesii 1704]